MRMKAEEYAVQPGGSLTAALEVRRQYAEDCSDPILSGERAIPHLAALDCGRAADPVSTTLGYANLRTTSAYTHTRSGENSARYLAV
jgi:hypothetical protein